MASAQMMCARIGMVTGHGLAGALRKKFPKPLIAATVQFRYHQIANVLKWLALTLFAYVITGS